MGVEYILKNSLLRRSLDNVTVVMIAFNNLKHTVFGHSDTNSKNENKNENENGNEISNKNKNSEC